MCLTFHFAAQCAKKWMAPLSLGSARRQQNWSSGCRSETWQWYLMTQNCKYKLYFSSALKKITTWIFKIVKFGAHFQLVLWINHSNGLGQITERFGVFQIKILWRVISYDPGEHRVLGEVVVCPSSNSVELRIQHALSATKKSWKLSMLHYLHQIIKVADFPAHPALSEPR